MAGKDAPILIDPRVRFGAPRVAGVPTWPLKDRWVSGEPLNEIAEDLSLKQPEILAALRFEGLDPLKPRKNEWLN